MARRILIGFALLLAAGLMLKIAPIAWRRVRLVYWQGKCLSYTAPADKAVPLNVSGGPSNSVPREWDEFYSLFSPPGVQSSGTLFLHERISPKGNRRLVAVDLSDRSSPIVGSLTRIIKPGSLFSEPWDVSPIGLHAAFPADLFFPGQPDAKDASHFTIRTISSGSEQILDGWLLDDDRVLIEPRSK